MTVGFYRASTFKILMAGETRQFCDIERTKEWLISMESGDAPWPI